MRSLAFIAVVAAACSPESGPRTPAPPVAQIERVDRIVHGLRPPAEVAGEPVRYALADRMKHYRVHGVSIAVFDHYQLQWARGFGEADAETHAPVTETTLFQAGSISKSVNALAMMLAVGKGTLALDAPIDQFLESWHVPANELTRTKPITLRMLLSHTAGTTVHGFPGYAAGEAVPTIQQVLDGKPPANTPPIVVDQEPGKAFRYSGGGITIAQLALVETMHEPYPQILRASVLGPLGMTRSTYDQPLPESRVPEAAAGYTSDGSPIAGKRHVYPEMAAAGLWTTPTDLATFFIELQRGLAGTSPIVTQAIAREMTTPMFAQDGDGLGVFVMDRNGAHMFGHDGADAGFQANAIASMEGGYGVIVMASSDNSFGLFGEIANAVFAEYGWPGRGPVLERGKAPPDPAIAGVYGTPMRATIVDVDRGRLYERHPFGERYEVVSTADGKLVDLRDGKPFQPAARLGDHASPLVELERAGLDAALAAVHALPADAFSPDELNFFAYGALDDNPKGAVAMFELEVAVIPDSMNAHESLAEGYEAIADKVKAIAQYKEALATEPVDTKATASFKQQLHATCVAAIARLGG
ncbi:MAG TPA: serine hydrolase domain-containing protein [Kofleriaceae bacterium]|jgi:CubicO group peptidase (beta-lactamase class C family)|nr:serine hydrolase domain-containing protein [Kofleriaceae bacterium]